MRSNRWPIFTRVVLLFCMLGSLEGVAQSQSQQQQPQSPQVTLQEAIKARTDAAVLQQDALALDREILQTMRKVLAKAEGKQMEGTILLTKDRYAEAVQAFQEAARLYQQVAESRKLLDRIANAKRAISAALLLAESTSTPEQLQEGRRLQINAEG